MPNMTITIPAPVLISGQYFKVRYRLVGDVSWTSIANQSNAPFVLSVAAGDYEMEVTFFNGTIDCSPTVQTFTVYEDYDCVDFVVTIEQDNSIYYLHIVYSIPSPYTYPPCGWDIIYTQNNVTTTVPFPLGLPLVGFVDITIPMNGACDVVVRQNLCNGLYQDCYNDTVVPALPSCIPYTNLVATMWKSSGYNLVLNFNMSIPATPFINLTYKQVGYVSPGLGVLDSGFINTPYLPVGAGSPSSITHKVFPNPNVEPHVVQYEGNFVDACGISHYFITAAIAF